MKRNTLNIGLAVVASVMLLVSCESDPLSPGVEYMPDMYRSPAVEAFQVFESTDSAQLYRMRKPIEGTIAHIDQDKMVYQMPYPHDNNTAGYDAAGADWKSPIPTTKETIMEGKQLFERFCIQCHGEGGAGDGSITQVSGGKYPVVPSYQSRQNITEGNMFHTLTWGKGLMGSHASQLNQEERWKVIQYVKVLMYEVDMEKLEFDGKGFLKGNPFTTSAAAPSEEQNENEG